MFQGLSHVPIPSVAGGSYRSQDFFEIPFVRPYPLTYKNDQICHRNTSRKQMFLRSYMSPLIKGTGHHRPQIFRIFYIRPHCMYSSKQISGGNQTR